MSPCCCLYLLIIQQGSPPVAALFFVWQLFKQLIVVCDELNLVGEVHTCTLVELLCDLFACGDVCPPFDMEHSKVPQDRQFVHVGMWCMFSMSLLKIILDLFTQLFPTPHIVLCFWLKPYSIKKKVGIFLLTL